MRKNKYAILFILVSIMALFYSCSKSKTVNSLEEYNKWLSSEANGLVKIKRINGFELRVKFLPVNYLAYKEYQDLEMTKGQKQFDSLRESYKTSLTFLFSICPDHEKGNNEDILISGVNSEQEYNEKVNTMSFNMDKYIKLMIEERELAPVLHNMENVSGLSQSRHFLFAFSDSTGLNMNKGFDFIYADELFKLGINHFMFDAKHLRNVPEIRL